MPSGWTLPDPGAVDKTQVEEMFPRNSAWNPANETNLVRLNLFPFSKAVTPFKCVSLFTGVGGLELGLHQPHWLALFLLP